MAVLLRHTLTLLIFQKSTQALAWCCSNALLLQCLSVSELRCCLSAICTNTVTLLERPQLNKINILQITENKKRMEVGLATCQWSGEVTSDTVL